MPSGPITRKIRIRGGKVVSDTAGELGPKPLEPESRDPENPQSYPSLIRQVANFAAGAARFVTSGFKTAAEKEISRRLAICHDCEHFDGERGACRLCGCPVKAASEWRRRLGNVGGMVVDRNKLASAHESCPIGKWGPVKEN